MKILVGLLSCLCLFVNVVSAHVQFDLPHTSSYLTQVDNSTYIMLSGGYHRYLLSLSTDGGRTFYETTGLTSLAKAIDKVSIGVVVANSQSKNVFFGTNGNGGLYRYNVDSDTWLVVKPLPITQTFSAAVIGKEGRLFVGTGGFEGNNDYYRRGIFYSDDDGITWDTLPRFDPAFAWGMVLALCVLDDGRLVASTKNPLMGVLVYDESTGWSKVSGDYPSHIVAVGTDVYYGSNPLVNIDLASAEHVVKRRRGGGEKVSSIIQWDADTLMVVFYNSSSDSVVVLSLMVDTNVVRELGKVDMQSVSGLTKVDINDEHFFVFPTKQEYEWQNSDWELKWTSTFTTPRPVVFPSGVSSSKEFVVENVQRHGVWVLESDGSSSRINRTDVNRGFEASPIGNTIYADQVLTYSKENIFSCKKGLADLINPLGLSCAQGEVIQNVVAISENTFYIRVDTSWVRFNSYNQDCERVTNNGWPRYSNQWGTYLHACAAAFAYENELYAWAQGDFGTYPNDFHANGGLYKLTDNQWVKVDSNRFGVNTNLDVMVADKDRVVVGLHQTYAATHSRSVELHMLDLKTNTWKMIANHDQTSPTLSALGLIDSNTVGWATYDEKLWFQTGAETPWFTKEFPLVYHIGYIGNSALVVTADSGSYLLDNEIVSVSNELERDNSEEMRVWPNPTSTIVLISLGQSTLKSISDVVYLTDPAGMLHGAKVLVVHKDAGNNISLTLDVSGLPCGVYYYKSEKGQVAVPIVIAR